MNICIRAHDLGVRGIENVAAELERLGLDGVQLVVYKVTDIPYKPIFTTADAVHIKKVLEGAGKKTVLIGSYFNPVHSDREKTENGIAVFKNYLRESSALGCGIVGSETGSYNDDKWTYHPENRTDRALGRVVDVFRELCDCAAEYGAYVGMEGAFGHVCYDVDRLALAVKMIGRDNIKIIFDLYNYLDISNIGQMYDILEHGLEVFGDRIEVFHIKDCTVTDGKLKQCGVGRGIFDYTRILTAINRINPSANLVLEGTTGEDIPYAVKFIKEKLNALN